MAIMLKIRWDINKGREQEFRENQRKLCAVMSGDHPGVICYHVDYPASDVSEWTEVADRPVPAGRRRCKNFPRSDVRIHD